MSYQYLAIDPTADAFLPCRHPDWTVDVVKHLLDRLNKSLILHISYNVCLELCAPCKEQTSLPALLE